MNGGQFWVWWQVEGSIGYGASAMGIAVDSDITGPQLWVEG